MSRLAWQAGTQPACTTSQQDAHLGARLFLAHTRGSCRAQPESRLQTSSHGRERRAVCPRQLSFLFADGWQKIEVAKVIVFVLKSNVWSVSNTLFRDRSFTATGPHIWNSLPAELRAPGLSVDCFKKDLNHTLFDLVTGDLNALWLSAFSTLQVRFLYVCSIELHGWKRWFLSFWVFGFFKTFFGLKASKGRIFYFYGFWILIFFV